VPERCGARGPRGNFQPAPGAEAIDAQRGKTAELLSFGIGTRPWVRLDETPVEYGGFTEVTMVAELNIVTEWLPEQMEPGSIFVLENAGEVGDQEDPYWAVLSCPECGTLGLITRRQMRGVVPVICGSSTCPAQFVILNEQVVPRRPN
jgi:hypothetical protein